MAVDADESAHGIGIGLNSESILINFVCRPAMLNEQVVKESINWDPALREKAMLACQAWEAGIFPKFQDISTGVLSV